MTTKRLPCPKCGTPLTVGDNLVGKRARCAACNSVVRITEQGLALQGPQETPPDPPGAEAALMECPYCGEYLDEELRKEASDVKNPRRGKPAMLIGGAMSVVGLLLWIERWSKGDQRLASMAAILLGAGLVVYAVGRFIHWWQWE